MKLSIEDIQNRISERCPTITSKPAEAFHGEMTKFIAHCTKCGHTWTAQARTLMQMKGCKYCKRWSLSKVRKRVHKMHPYLRIYGKVTNESSKVTVICLICKKAGRSYRWQETVNNLIEGKGCKYCENQKGFQKETMSLSFYQKQINDKYHGDIKISLLPGHHVFKGKKDKIKAYCIKHGYPWITTCDALLRPSACGCPVATNIQSGLTNRLQAKYRFKQWYLHQHSVQIVDKSYQDYHGANTIFKVKCLKCGAIYRTKAYYLEYQPLHGCRIVSDFAEVIVIE